MRKTITSFMLSLIATFAFATETATVVFDGSALTSTATTADTEFTYGGFTLVMSKGAKYQASSGANRFADKAILIGKKDTYIYNKNPFPGKIVKFEIYSNKGASANVTVGVNFSNSPIAAYDESAANTYTGKLNTLDNVYDLTSELPGDARYFWFQVTNAYNSQVQFRITYELAADVVKNPEFSVLGGDFYTPQVVALTAAEDADIYYSFDGQNYQKYASSLIISEDATLYAYAEENGKQSDVVTASYRVAKTYASFEELCKVTPESQPVIVSFDKKEIVGLYVTKDGHCNGVYLMSGDRKIEIYCYNVPEGWEEGGFISGTVQGKWQDYNGTWEVCPSTWDGVAYTAPVAPEVKPVVIQSYKLDQDGGLMALIPQLSCAAIVKYLNVASADDVEIHAVMPDGTTDEATDGRGATDGWRDADGNWCEEDEAVFYSRPVFEIFDGGYNIGANMGATDKATEGMSLTTPFTFVNKSNNRAVTVVFTVKKSGTPVYTFVKKSAQVLEVSRTVGLATAETKASFDTESVCSALGISGIEEAEVFGINSSVAWNVAPVKWIENPMASYEGWRDGNGDFCNANDAGAAVCVKLLAQDTDNIVISTAAANEPKATEPVFNAYYVLAANEKAVLIITQITFVSEESDGATAITSVKGGDDRTADIFDLTGRKVSDLTRGRIYIVNGRKVILK
ncbi:MAG: chitobiase/beta-hexosaminidase C-terminal domain-containing protein [Bacteroidaceae bacterium]|nr:chitobiase/beta-hexosaminidase C-terminal domain-containing protein [Bacteroidaceae bacterium]